MGRADHNWKRRAKLIEKHTGRVYNPYAGGRSDYSRFVGGYGDGAGKSKGERKGANLQTWEEDHADEKTKGKRKRITTRAVGEAADTVPRQKSRLIRSLDVHAAHEQRIAVVRSTQKLDVTRALKRPVGTATQVKKSTVANMTFLTTGKFGEPPRKMTRKQMRTAWALAHKRVRHQAFVVCPGSLTDRFARGGQAHAAIFAPLDHADRRLLSSGALSWRWLREEFDFADLPQRPVVHDIDPRAHKEALQTSIASMAEVVAKRLRRFDSLLGSDGRWPLCAARVKLAAKMGTRKAIHKRCVHFFDEVLKPLLTESTLGGAAAPLFSQAQDLCTRSAETWYIKGGETLSLRLDEADVRGAWLQMLRCCLTQEEPDPWLQAVRSCTLARLCPQVTTEALQAMFGRASELAKKAASSKIAAPPPAAASMVMLPLGVFTPWQALLLVAMANWLGFEATVVRREAKGTASVLFRSLST